MLEMYANRAGQFHTYTWYLLFCVVSSLTQGRERTLLPQPRWSERVCSGHYRPLSELSGPWKHKEQPRAHKDTQRPQSLWRALSSSSEQMFIPQRFPSSWDLSSALKKKGRKRNLKLFTLIIPFCCSCLFCFALSSSHTLRSLHVRKLPSCSLEQILP